MRRRFLQENRYPGKHAWEAETARKREELWVPGKEAGSAAITDVLTDEGSSSCLAGYPGIPFRIIYGGPVFTEEGRPFPPPSLSRQNFVSGGGPTSISEISGPPPSLFPGNGFSRIPFAAFSAPRKPGPATENGRKNQPTEEGIENEDFRHG